MEMSNYNFTDTQKESCAVSLMRDTVKELALRDTISYEDALLRFTNSKVYETLFDYDTGIWRESPDYLLNLGSLVFSGCLPGLPSSSFMAVGFGFLPLVDIGFPSLLQKWVKKKDLRRSP